MSVASTTWPTPRTSIDSPGRGERAAWLPAAVLAVLMAGTAVALLHAARGTTFAYDDWNLVLDRRAWSAHALLAPHNEHLSLVPVLVYKLTFETLGLDHYGFLRAILVALDLLCGLLLFLYARPRIGSWPAVAVTAPLMLMGAAYWDLIWAFQIGYLCSLAAGLGALLALDRADRRGDVAAGLLLGVALASSGMGLPIVAGAVVDVLLRPNWRRRVWVVAAPIAVYAIWYVGYGRGAAKLENVPAVPDWILQAAGPAAGAISGAGSDYGTLLAVGLTVFVVRAVLRPGRLDPRIAALVVIPLALWTSTALARANTGVSPGEARYLYPGGLFVGLLAVELARGRYVRGRAAVLLVGALAAGAVANAHAFRGVAASVRSLSVGDKAALSALELVGNRVDPALQPLAGQPQVTAGRYLDAIRHYGSSPAYAPGALERAPAKTRAIADSVLVRQRAVTATPVPATSAPPTATTPPSASATAAAIERRPGCVRFTPTAAVGQAAVTVPPAGLLIRATPQTGLDVRFRRFADRFGSPLAQGVAAGNAATVKAVPDRSQRPWQVGLRGTAPFTVCSLR